MVYYLDDPAKCGAVTISGTRGSRSVAVGWLLRYAPLLAGGLASTKRITKHVAT